MKSKHFLCIVLDFSEHPMMSHQPYYDSSSGAKVQFIYLGSAQLLMLCD